MECGSQTVTNNTIITTSEASVTAGTTLSVTTRQPWRAVPRSEIMSWALVFSLTAILVGVNHSLLDNASPKTAAFIALVTALVGLFCCRRMYATKEGSASFLFVLCFSLFNLGLAPLVLFGVSIPTFGLSPTQLLWLTSSQFEPALVLATIGLLALMAGTAIGALWGSARWIPERQSPEDKLAKGDLARAIGIPGALFMTISVGAFFLVALKYAGVSGFTAGYENWQTATANAPLPYVYAPLGLSLGMLAIATPSKARRFGLLMFAVYALVALYIGLRSEVMFPAAGALVLISYRRRILTGKRLLLVLIIGLLLVSGIRSSRNNSITTGTAASSVGISPVDGLAEMGFSLRPTVVVMQWNDNGQSKLGEAASRLRSPERVIGLYHSSVLQRLLLAIQTS